MELSRRRAVRIVGASMPVGFLAGCLSNQAPGDDGETDPDGNRSPGGDSDDGGDRSAEQLAQVEEPSYEISEPDCGEDGDRDPLWLCEHMASEPSLAFEQVETTSVVFSDEGVDLEGMQQGVSQLYAGLLTDESDLERIAEGVGGDVGDLIEQTDFDAEAVLVVQTGWGSGSETPHLKRIEEVDDGIHAFGCYRRPCGGTTDVTVRTVLAQLERPERLDRAVVSVTVDPRTQVNITADEGIVTVDER